MGGHLYIAALKIQQCPCTLLQFWAANLSASHQGGRQQPDSSFSRRSLAEQERSRQNDRGGIGFFFERAAYVFEGNFIQGSDVQPKFESGKRKKKVREWARLGLVGGGAAGVNLELHCSRFLLSFWKVGSHSEAISRVLM